MIRFKLINKIFIICFVAFEAINLLVYLLTEKTAAFYFPMAGSAWVTTLYNSSVPKWIQIFVQIAFMILMLTLPYMIRRLFGKIEKYGKTFFILDCLSVFYLLLDAVFVVILNKINFTPRSYGVDILLYGESWIPAISIIVDIFWIVFMLVNQIQDTMTFLQEKKR
ncbi:MAG: hypothetical protein IJT38_01685 [Clostridia bacterium]|nr:hypothetical protein [Clostridia bacterium]